MQSSRRLLGRKGSSTEGASRKTSSNSPCPSPPSPPPPYSASVHRKADSSPAAPCTSPVTLDARAFCPQAPRPVGQGEGEGGGKRGGGTGPGRLLHFDQLANLRHGEVGEGGEGGGECGVRYPHEGLVEEEGGGGEGRAYHASRHAPTHLDRSREAATVKVRVRFPEGRPENDCLRLLFHCQVVKGKPDANIEAEVHFDRNKVGGAKGADRRSSAWLSSARNVRAPLTL